MKWHITSRLFMSMLIMNYWKPHENIWEKQQGVDIIKLMNLHLLSHYSYLLPFRHILIVKLELIFKDLSDY
jgi:hypothetical protein